MSVIEASTSIDILEQSEQLGHMVVESDIYIEYREAKKAMKEDPEAQEKINNFLSWKDQYDEVQRFGAYHPDYKTTAKQVRVVKREMDMHETVIRYRQAEKALDNLLTEISTLVAESVSSSIKVPTGNPFYDNQSGGCSTGGGCGCS